MDSREAGVQLLQKMESGEEHPWLPHPLAVGQPTPDQSKRGIYKRIEGLCVQEQIQNNKVVDRAFFSEGVSAPQ